jgi:hypothetical protein
MSSFAVESADCRTVFTDRSNGDSRLFLPVRTEDAVDEDDANVLGSPLAKTLVLSGGMAAGCGRSGALEL